MVKLWIHLLFRLKTQNIISKKNSSDIFKFDEFFLCNGMVIDFYFITLHNK
jgi:hypothetical protein